MELQCGLYLQDLKKPAFMIFFNLKFETTLGSFFCKKFSKSKQKRMRRKLTIKKILNEQYGQRENGSRRIIGKTTGHVKC